MSATADHAPSRTTPARPIRVAVFGAGGRMGSTVCRAVEADPGLELVAAIDPHHGGLDLRTVASVQSDLSVLHGPEALRNLEVDVAIEFTEASAARSNLAAVAELGIHAVVGTTGFSDSDIAVFRQQFVTSNCLIAPNFAIGALLMMKCAAIAAPYFDTVEVLEFHHNAKVDAPSGTAMLTAERIAEASATWAEDPTTSVETPGDPRGGIGPADIRIHSVRMSGMVAHQDVILGTTGQTLTIRHDSYDRTSFMPGVLMATKAINSHPGVTVGLDTLLGL